MLPQFAPNMPFDFIYIAHSLIFIPAISPTGTEFPLIFPAWTLTYEMVFYLVLTLSFTLFKRRAFLATSLILISLHTLQYTSLVEYVSIRRSTEIVLLDFILGIAVYHLWIKGAVTQMMSYSILVASVILILLAPDHVDMSWRRLVFWSLPAAGIVVFALSCENYLKDGLITRLLVYLGTASFSIYLVHDFTIKIFYTIASRMDWFNALGPALLMGCVFLFSIVVSVIVYELFERPMYRLTKALKPYFFGLKR